MRNEYTRKPIESADDDDEQDGKKEQRRPEFQFIRPTGDDSEGILSFWSKPEAEESKRPSEEQESDHKPLLRPERPLPVPGLIPNAELPPTDLTAEAIDQDKEEDDEDEDEDEDKKVDSAASAVKTEAEAETIGRPTKLDTLLANLKAQFINPVETVDSVAPPEDEPLYVSHPAPPPPPPPVRPGGLPPVPPIEIRGAPPVEAPEPWQAPVAAPAEPEGYARVFERPAVDEEAVRDAAYYGEKRGLARGLITGLAAGYLIKRFFANRALLRVEQAAGEHASEQRQQIEGLQIDQTTLEQRLHDMRDRLEEVKRVQTRPEASTGAPQPEKALRGSEAQAEQSNDQVAAYDLQPGQRVNHSSWHNIVVDERGHEVQNAINYGEAFQEEQRRERQPVGTGDQTSPAAATTPLVTSGLVSTLLRTPSGQVPTSQQLPSGMSPDADANHRLPDTTSTPLAQAASNPWLWAGILVLLVAFFAAAFL